MAKNKENFQKMNCDDCQCNNCLGACINCCRCYRAEYAEEEYADFYYKGKGKENCSEKDENFQW